MKSSRKIDWVAEHGWCPEGNGELWGRALKTAYSDEKSLHSLFAVNTLWLESSLEKEKGILRRMEEDKQGKSLVGTDIQILKVVKNWGRHSEGAGRKKR